MFKVFISEQFLDFDFLKIWNQCYLCGEILALRRLYQIIFKIDWAPLWMNFSILSSPVWLLFQIWINQLGWFWLVWAMNLWNLLKMGDLRHHRHSSSSMDWIGVIFIKNLTLHLVYLESAFRILFWDASLNNQYIFEHFHR